MPTELPIPPILPLSLLQDPARTKVYACEGHELFYSFRDPATGMTAFYNLIDNRWAIYSRMSDAEFDNVVSLAISAAQDFLGITRH